MKIFIATGNEHKVKELQEIFSGEKFACEIFSAKELGGMPYHVEDGNTFEENAFIKAKALRKIAPPDSYVLADDSGLVVDALNGEPGIYSARYAGVEGKEADIENNKKLLKNLKGVPMLERTARFICVLALIEPDGIKKSFEGKVEGFIVDDARGKNGFGYDPLFFFPEYNCTTAELPSLKKHLISHRGNALRKLVKYLLSK